MAKNEKSRVRVFFGEIEGDDETIRDALRSIAASVQRTFQPNTTIIKTLAVEGKADEKQIAEMAESAEINASDAEIGLDDPPSAKPAKTASQRTRKSISYNFINDLNLRPEGKQSIREFYAEKQPAGQQQQFTVLVYYLYRILGLQGVTTNHVYTAIKGIEGFRVPTDIGGVLRSVANRKGWIDSSDSQAFKTTTSGDNLVEHDLPPGKSLGKNSE